LFFPLTPIVVLVSFSIFAVALQGAGVSRGIFDRFDLCGEIMSSSSCSLPCPIHSLVLPRSLTVSPYQLELSTLTMQASNQRLYSPISCSSCPIDFHLLAAHQPRDSPRPIIYLLSPTIRHTSTSLLQELFPSRRTLASEFPTSILFPHPFDTQQEANSPVSISIPPTSRGNQSMLQL